MCNHCAKLRGNPLKMLPVLLGDIAGRVAPGLRAVCLLLTLLRGWLPVLPRLQTHVSSGFGASPPGYRPKGAKIKVLPQAPACCPLSLSSCSDHKPWSRPWFLPSPAARIRSVHTCTGSPSRHTPGLGPKARFLQEAHGSCPRLPRPLLSAARVTRHSPRGRMRLLHSTHRLDPPALHRTQRPIPCLTVTPLQPFTLISSSGPLTAV